MKIKNIFLTIVSMMFLSCANDIIGSNNTPLNSAPEISRIPSQEEKDLLKLMNENMIFPNIDSRADHYSLFIFENSLHDLSSPETVSDINETGKLAKAILDYINKKTSTKPIMRCGHRNNLLKALLQISNIESRLINIQGNGQPYNTLLGHVILEYKNEDCHWILADSDYLIYWIDKDSSKRMGTRDVITLDYNQIVPCKVNTNECGYNTQNAERSSPQTFIDLGLFTGAIVLSSQYGNGSYMEFLYNPQKLSPSTLVEGKTIPERYAFLPIIFLTK